MNRILLWEDASTTSSIQSAEQSFEGLTEKGQPERGRTSLFAPLHYEENYAYPLVIWLHGPDDDQRQLKQIMPLVSMRNYVGVGPCGTLEIPTVVEAADVDSMDRPTFSWSDSESDVMLASSRVFDAIDIAASRFNVDRSRVFLAGYDAGGTMAMRLALLNPTLFAGAASLGGSFPTGNTPLVSIKDARKLPLFLAHCRDSEQYNIDQMCDDLKLIHSAGIRLALREYPCEQELTTKMLSDLDAWMMELVTNSSIEAPQLSEIRKSE